MIEKKYVVDGIEISNPAPVLIPTLCRFQHLKNLLESLSKCHGAEFTEVYIAVDYPLKESHWDGYNKICQYLDNAGKLGFKSLNIIKRDKNYGFGKNGNFRILVSDMLQKYDKYIGSEDDNIFAYEFLDFINYNLAKYENDKSVMAVSGYMNPVLEDLGKRYALRLENFSAWGFGIWKDRAIENYYYSDSLDAKKRIVEDYSFELKCKKHRLNIFTDMLGMVRGKPIWGDALYTAMLLHHKKSCICPSKSLVRNMGWDGTGMHGGSKKCKSPLLTQKIDESNHQYNYEDASSEINELFNEAMYKYFRKYTPMIQKGLTYSTYIYYKIFGKYYDFTFFRRIWKKYFRK